MIIEKKLQGTTAELKLKGWLDTQAAPILEAEIEQLGEGVTEVVFDCAELEYISSAGLRQIVAAYKKVGGALSLRRVSDEIMGIIKMTGLDKRMKFE